MHVVMTYPAALTRRGSVWAAAARRGGSDVTEIVLVDSLDHAPLPAISWLAQPAKDRYHLELPIRRTERKRTKRLADRVRQAIEIAAAGDRIDILHTISARASGFAAAVTEELDIPHFHMEAEPGFPSEHSAVFDNADAIRTWSGDRGAAGLPDAYRDRLYPVPTPIDFSLDGAPPQLTAIDGETETIAPMRPWLAAISPRKIVWRGDLSSPAAVAMVETFAELRLTGTQLEMVGPGAWLSDIEGITERLGLEGRITVHDVGTPGQTVQAIGEADLLIVGDDDPSIERETITSLVLGTPVLVPPTPVYTELVTDAVGVVVDAGDRAELRRAIRRTTMVDVHDQIMMAARASRHTLASVGAELAAVYHELTDAEVRPQQRRTLEVHDGGRLAG